jgi:WXXGXW repeat (2 copies)
MKSKWLLGLVAASALSAPAFGQIQIYIGTPPPPVRYEVVPPMPAEGFVWMAGFWEPQGPRYRWVPGRYERAPEPGAYWAPARYEHDDHGWKLHKGYWEHRGNPHFDRDDHNGHREDHEDHGHGHGHGHDRD